MGLEPFLGGHYSAGRFLKDTRASLFPFCKEVGPAPCLRQADSWIRTVNFIAKSYCVEDKVQIQCLDVAQSGTGFWLALLCGASVFSLSISIYSAEASRKTALSLCITKISKHDKSLLSFL